MFKKVTFWVSSDENLLFKRILSIAISIGFFFFINFICDKGFALDSLALSNVYDISLAFGVILATTGAFYPKLGLKIEWIFIYVIFFILFLIISILVLGTQSSSSGTTNKGTSNNKTKSTNKTKELSSAYEKNGRIEVRYNDGSTRPVTYFSKGFEGKLNGYTDSKVTFTKNNVVYEWDSNTGITKFVTRIDKGGKNEK